MALQAGRKPYNTFVAGIITEASALTFPEDASIDEQNYILNKNGSRRRRLGLDIETNSALTTTTWADSIWQEETIASFEWNDAASRGLYNFAVLQIGEELYFFSMASSPVIAVDDADWDFNISLSTFRAPGDGINFANSPIRVSNGNGYLFITSKNHSPIYVSYNPELDTMTATEIQIEVRDFVGFDDGVAGGERPSVANAYYKYNMYNRGWTSAYLADYLAANGVYPSKAEIPAAYRRQTAKINVTTGDVETEAGEFSPELIPNSYINFGNSDSVAGHFIISPFEKDRAGAVFDETSETLSLGTPLTERFRPKCCAFFAGRVWYAGVESTIGQQTNYKDAPANGALYFSQMILDDITKVGKCYQEYDPTSEEDSDLLATDGGVIQITGVEQVYSIHSIDNSLVVVASNGVWQVGGGDIGFTAKEFQVIKISEDGAVGAQSVVEADGILMYWAKSGIILMNRNETSGFLTPTNITIDTIQTLYTDINNVAKRNAVGTFDRAASRVFWLYNDGDENEYNGTEYRNAYNAELRFDFALKAFYKYKFGELSTNPPYVCGYVKTPYTSSGTIEYNLTLNDGSTGITLNDGVELVVVEDSLPLRGSSSVLYTTVFPNGTTFQIGFCSFNNTSFLDFYSVDSTGIDAEAYLITGYEILEDAAPNKYAKYLHTFMEQTETGWEDANSDSTFELDNPSGCLVQARWDFANHANWGKFTNNVSSFTTSSTGWQTTNYTTGTFQIYKLHRFTTPSSTTDSLNYGTAVVRTKNKIRGKGRALSLKFSTEAGKDCSILGWYLDFLGQTEA